MKNDLRSEHLGQDVTVVLPLSVVLRINEERPPLASVAIDAPCPVWGWRAIGGGLPELGAPMHGGTFEGLTIHQGMPASLILLPGSIEDASWQRAGEWAKEQGGELPSRFDSLVLFKNSKSKFKEAAYWTGEQSEHDAGYAWGQDFYYGGQYYWRKDGSFRAVAVRRIPIQ